VQVEGRTYKDKVLWDLNEPQNSPDEFAYSVCTDLSLPASFVDLIRNEVLKQLVEKWKVRSPLSAPSHEVSSCRTLRNGDWRTRTAVV
jgi:hypothetical protein